MINYARAGGAVAFNDSVENRKLQSGDIINVSQFKDYWKEILILGFIPTPRDDGYYVLNEVFGVYNYKLTSLIDAMNTLVNKMGEKLEPDDPPKVEDLKDLLCKCIDKQEEDLWDIFFKRAVRGENIRATSFDEKVLQRMINNIPNLQNDKESITETYRDMLKRQYNITYNTYAEKKMG
jgi:hypothetical protein